MSFLIKYKNWLIVLFTVAIIAGSAIYVMNYEQGKLEQCKKEETGTIIETEEKEGGRWRMQYKYTVGSTEYITSEIIENKEAVKFFALGQTIDIYYSCTNPKVSRSKKTDE